MPERLADLPLAETDSSDFDENSFQSAADHPRHERKLLALPQVRQRREAEALADMLDAQTLVVGKDGARRDSGDFRVFGLSVSALHGKGGSQ